MSPQPETTASLGKLVVDERNGYLGISKTEKGKEPIQWFKITDIENPGLYCIKPRIGWGNKVAVGCEFVCDIPSQHRRIKVVVKQRIYCKHRTYTKNSHYEEWDEPGTISIMRGIISQTYEHAVQSEWENISTKLRFIHNSLEEQALCAMFLDENYTTEQLDERFNQLKEILKDDAKQLDLLTSYYKALKQAFICEE